MVITIDKAEVLTDVMREAEYAGAKGSDYDRTRIIDTDEELLRRWISDACLRIESELSELGGTGIAAGSTWILQTTNANGKDTWGSATAQSFVESRVLGEWMLLVGMIERAEVAMAKAEGKMQELKRIAYYRVEN